MIVAWLDILIYSRLMNPGMDRIEFELEGQIINTHMTKSFLQGFP